MNKQALVAGVIATIMALCAIAVVTASESADAVEAKEVEVDDSSFHTQLDGVNENEPTVLKLTGDVILTKAAEIGSGKTVTIDLNGHTITTGVDYKIISSGDLTIKDSTATAGPTVNQDYTVSYTSGKITGNPSKGGPVHAQSGGKVTFVSGTIESTNIGLVSKGTTSETTGDATVVVEGGYIHSREFAVSAQGDGASVTIKGGVLQADDNAALAGNGSAGLGGTNMVVEGGYLISNIVSSGYIACGIYAPNHGIVEVSGGTIYANGGVGILSRAGVVEITGGTIIAAGQSEGKVGDKSTSIPSAAVVIDNENPSYPGSNTGEFRTDISGGSFSSEIDGIVAVLVGSDSKGALGITGGTFNKSVGEEFIVPGYTETENNGVFTVSAVAADGAAASIDGVYYGTLADAIEVAEAGDTVIVLKDVSEAVTIDKSITLLGSTDLVLEYDENGFPVAVNSRDTKKLSGDITVTGQEVTISGLELSGLVTVAAGCSDFCLENNHMTGKKDAPSNADSVLITGTVKVNIGGNYWSPSNAYNLIEMSSSAMLSAGSSISYNYFSKGSCTHNQITITEIEDDLTVEYNRVGYTEGGIRLSGSLTDDAKTFTFRANILDSTCTGPYGGLVMYQPYGASWNSVNVTLILVGNEIPDYASQVFYTYGMNAGDSLTVYVDDESYDVPETYGPMVKVGDKNYFSLEYAISYIGAGFSGTILADTVNIDGTAVQDREVEVAFDSNGPSRVTIGTTEVVAYTYAITGGSITIDAFTSVSKAEASGTDYIVLVSSVKDEDTGAVIITPGEVSDQGTVSVSVGSGLIEEGTDDAKVIINDVGAVSAPIVVTIESDAIQNVSSSLTIESSIGTVTLDKATLDKIAGGSDATVTITDVSTEAGYGLTDPSSQEFVGQFTDPTVLDLDVGTNNTGLNLTVTVRFIVPEGFHPVVYYVGDDGTQERMEDVRSDGTSVTFTTTHCSVYLVAAEEDPAPVIPDDPVYPVFPPFIPDDEPVIPPVVIVPADPGNDGEDPTKVAAVVAAAVAAAILAAFIVMDYRKR